MKNVLKGEYITAEGEERLQISKEKSVLKHEIEKIISANIWIDFYNFAAYFLENGKSEECRLV